MACGRADRSEAPAKKAAASWRRPEAQMVVRHHQAQNKQRAFGQTVVLRLAAIPTLLTAQSVKHDKHRKT